MTKKQRIEALEKEVAELRLIIKRLQDAVAPPVPFVPPIAPLPEPFPQPWQPWPEYQPFTPYIPTRTSDNTRGEPIGNVGS